ncbi:MAG: hotdog domain-containing protein [Rhodoferax sp.]|uniref:acyl-CoA thioesterase n=1 Tax=Rhodoferax sp. TaxID=50421 RepID=UPI002ACEEB5C|nr:hotdog domain-containing protein [Rhodoferax sp.]MDZ7892301.1 hotdog domain-containing protein [Rhodoferax sp.]
MSVVDMVWPDQSNHHGTLFGGAALAALDRLAFIMGSKVLRGTVVTAAVSRLDFAAPAPAGHLIECNAEVVHRGRRSVTLKTELVAEALLTGERTRCLSGDFVMVRQQAPEETSSALAPTAADAGGFLQEISDRTVVRLAEIVFPGHANHRGILHGGPAMAWLAKAGFVAATRHMRRTVVMASSERMDFVAPAHVGEVVEVIAHVTRVGNRSITVQADMWSESPVTGARRLCTSSSLVYVSVDH